MIKRKKRNITDNNAHQLEAKLLFNGFTKYLALIIFLVVSLIMSGVMFGLVDSLLKLISKEMNYQLTEIQLDRNQSHIIAISSAIGTICLAYLTTIGLFLKSIIKIREINAEHIQKNQHVILNKVDEINAQARTVPSPLGSTYPPSPVGPTFPPTPQGSSLKPTPQGSTFKPTPQGSTFQPTPPRPKK